MKNIVKMEKKKVNLYKNQYKLYSPDIPQPTSPVCNFTMQFKNFALLNSTKKPYEKRKSFSPSVYALKSYGRLQTKNSKGYFSDNKISLSNELFCDSVCT